MPWTKKIFGYYNTQTGEAAIDPIFFKDTKYSKDVERLGMEVKMPSSDETIVEEVIIHPWQDSME